MTLVGIRRKAVTPYTFSDGTHVAAGNWVCVPLHSIQRDSDYYRDPETFEGFRFAPSQPMPGQSSRGMYTDTKFSFPFWGMGKRAWYVYTVLPFIPIPKVILMKGQPWSLSCIMDDEAHSR
jgi:cytochrome P450